MDIDVDLAYKHKVQMFRHCGSKAQDKGIPETMVRRILMFMWSFRPLSVTSL